MIDQKYTENGQRMKMLCAEGDAPIIRDIIGLCIDPTKKKRVYEYHIRYTYTKKFLCMLVNVQRKNYKLSKLKRNLK